MLDLTPELYIGGSNFYERHHYEIWRNKVLDEVCIIYRASRGSKTWKELVKVVSV